MSKVFSTLELKKNKILKNRLAVAPMTTQQSNADGSISNAESDWLIMLAEDGIDYIHSSQMYYAAVTAKYSEKTSIEYLRSHITRQLPLVIPGSITSIDDAEKAMDLGADIIAIGRAAIGNKKVPEYFEEHRELPFKTPFSEKHLEETGISKELINYVKNAPPLRSLNIVQQ
jgi:2,4-dienoyl-CoA reductase-like NADH-dependent reductase (Old Yellow Enzyme family)